MHAVPGPRWRAVCSDDADGDCVGGAVCTRLAVRAGGQALVAPQPCTSLLAYCWWFLSGRLASDAELQWLTGGHAGCVSSDQPQDSDIDSQNRSRVRLADLLGI